MKIYNLLSICCALVLFMTSCEQSTTNDISVKEVHTIQQTSNSPYTIIDVRTPDEFVGGHISGALNVDVKSDQFEDEIKKLNPSDKYIIYCRSGKRSARAYNIMEKLNFENLYNMEGGYLKYQDEILNN